jgi:hypothetical protein
MVLSREKEESAGALGSSLLGRGATTNPMARKRRLAPPQVGAGAKEIRTKGEEKQRHPHPPTLKTQFLRGTNQCKRKIINILNNKTSVLISKHKPRKTTVF